MTWQDIMVLAYAMPNETIRVRQQGLGGGMIRIISVREPGDSFPEDLQVR
jgi:hypothetical protein